MHRRGLLKYVAGLMLGTPALHSVANDTLPAAASPIGILDARIAGFAHYQGEVCLPFMKAGDRLALRREPENPKDRRAVEIYWRHKKIGYVPRIQNRALSRLMHQGYAVQAKVRTIDDGLLWEPLYFEVELLDSNRS